MRPLLKRSEKRWILLLFLLPFLPPLLFFLLSQREPQPLHRFEATSGTGAQLAAYATSVAYSPDGRTLACAFAVEQGRKVVGGALQLWTPAEIRLYDAHNGALRQTIHLGSGAVAGLGYSPNGSTLRADCQDGFTRWWDVASGQVLRQVWQGKERLMASSPDGRWQIAQREPKPNAPPYNYVILLRDNNTGQVVHSFIIGERPITAAAFSSDGRQFVLAGDTKPDYDIVARFYRTSDCKLLGSQNWGSSDVFWMAFTSRSQITGISGSPFLWRGGPEVQELEWVRGDFRSGAVSPDDQWLAAGGWQLDPPWRTLLDLHYMPDADSEAYFGHAAVWELSSGQCLWHMRTGGKIVGEVALAPDKSEIAVVVSDTMYWSSEKRGHVEVWSLPPSPR